MAESRRAHKLGLLAPRERISSHQVLLGVSLRLPMSTPRHLPLQVLLLLAVACSGSSSTGTPHDGGDSSSSSGGSSSGGSGGGSGSGSGGSSSGGSSSGGSSSGGQPPVEDAGPPSDGGGRTTFGAVHTGQYNLGPVEWTGSFTNSCGPYASSIEAMEGVYLAGLDNSFNGDGSLCDACILMQTAKGKSIVLRVITTGVSAAPTNADISQEAYSVINEGENPRTMTWQLVQCPDTGTLQYQYQTEANAYWTSLWVRNGRAPITTVEVMPTGSTAWSALTRGTDGTLTDASGFGSGAFKLRVTGMDGTTVTDSFPSFTPGAVVASTQQIE